MSGRTCEIIAPDGRLLHVYDTGAGAGGDTAVIWHHGTPQTGEPPVPLLPELGRRGIRFVSYDRPGYGRSARFQGRTVASAAADVMAIADALDIAEFATIGVSSGAPHALACAALLPGRVTGVVTVAGPAPFGAEGLDWFADMAEVAAARIRAGARGRQAIEAHLAATGFPAGSMTASDLAALVADWRWLGPASERAMANGLPGIVDDLLSVVRPWGFTLSVISTPVLIIHGGSDRIVPSAHAEWLARHLGAAELWLRPGDGHMAVLTSCTAALDWVISPATRRCQAR
jgi:pimeloyl-ACP methyl ester carboxylesterase